ncbi:MarR family transcriptional regulator [Candidatus Pacebacteria bacterium]|nr:MarR family transcriptional regulator [Candidatus Paceibacterota bacterium]
MLLTTLIEYNKSYKAGLLQAKAFRILKAHTNDALRPHGINATEWGILGVLLHERKGYSYSRIAEEIGVKVPFVTRSIRTLTDLGYISVAADPEDTRSKIAMLTKEGTAFMKKTEPAVMAHVLKTFKGISKRDVLGYIKTLSAIIDNHSVPKVEMLDLEHLKVEA